MEKFFGGCNSTILWPNNWPSHWPFWSDRRCSFAWTIRNVKKAQTKMGAIYVSPRIVAVVILRGTYQNSKLLKWVQKVSKFDLRFSPSSSNITWNPMESVNKSIPIYQFFLKKACKQMYVFFSMHRPSKESLHFLLRIFRITHFK